MGVPAQNASFLQDGSFRGRLSQMPARLPLASLHKHMRALPDRARAVLVLLAILLVIMLTGWSASPFLFLLYVPILAGVLIDQRSGLLLGIALGLFYLAGAEAVAPAVSAPVAAATAASFPTMAACLLYLHSLREKELSALAARATELHGLLDMSQMMEAAYNLDMTLDIILLGVQDIVGSDIAGVYLLDNDVLTLKTSSRPGSGALVASMPLAAAHHAGWKLDETSASGLYVPEARPRLTASDDPDDDGPVFVPTLDDIHASQSFACLPLTCVEGLLGMIYVGFDRPKALTPEDVRALEALSTRAGFAVQRVLIQRNYESLAYSDYKTGLSNYRQFEQDLDQELDRARRYDRRLSIILLDIDHFREFNTAYGHPAGDAILAQLAVILRNSLRSTDKPARYGGEEFVILCPETGRDEARLVAQRINRAVSETEFDLTLATDENGTSAWHADLPRKACVTVSLGYATFPHDTHDARALVQIADDALYAAKQSGRDKVCGPESTQSATVS